jgi:hypothetical protein
LARVTLHEGDDQLSWALEKNEKYKALTFKGVTDSMLKDIWKGRIPLKIQIFLWMVSHDRTVRGSIEEEKMGWPSRV